MTPMTACRIRAAAWAGSGCLASSQAMTAEQVLAAMDAITTARERIDANVSPLLALEAMAVSLRLPRG